MRESLRIRSLALEDAEADHEAVAPRRTGRSKRHAGDDTDLLSVEPDVRAADHAARRIGRRMEGELSSVEHADAAEDENHECRGNDPERREHSDAASLSSGIGGT